MPTLGAAIDFTGVTMPFSVTDLLSSGSALLGFVGTFVLLGMAFVIVPKLIGLFRNSMGKGSKN